MKRINFCILYIAIAIGLQAQGSGILNQSAPRWDIDAWIDENGKNATYTLEELEGKTIFLFCFQSWCPGCHEYGFPTIKYLKNKYAHREDIVFLAIQTVFEGKSVNTQSKLKKLQKKYKLDIPFGHDPGSDRISNIVTRYNTGGTPWNIIIDPKGKVVFNDYQISPQEAKKIFNTVTLE